MKFQDLSAQVFGRLTVIERAPGRKKETRWKCRCECGNEKSIAAWDLKSGRTQSCGCLQQEARHSNNLLHGKSSSPIYAIWNAMRDRCVNPNSTAFKDYGARGITLCERWMEFENFLADMGETPDGMTIERKDNSKGYCKENCIWATMKDQARNKRNNRIIEADGKRLCLAAWAELMRVDPATIYSRIKEGWSEQRAVTTPNKWLKAA